MNRSDRLDLLFASVHELGHATACVHLNILFDYATVVPDEKSAGRVVGSRMPKSAYMIKDLRKKRGRDEFHFVDTDAVAARRVRTFYTRQIAMMFAGGAATALFFDSTRGSESDEHYAQECAIEDLDIPENRVEEFLAPLRKQAHDLVTISHVAHTIEALAVELIYAKTLSSRVIRKCYRRNQRSYRASGYHIPDNDSLAIRNSWLNFVDGRKVMRSAFFGKSLPLTGV